MFHDVGAVEGREPVYLVRQPLRTSALAHSLCKDIHTAEGFLLMVDVCVLSMTQVCRNVQQAEEYRGVGNMKKG